MRIEEELKLDYSDVLFRPKRSTLKSRKDVNLLRTYKFKYSNNEWSGIPIMAANMDGVGELGMADKLHEYQMITCLTKQHDVKKIKQFKNIKKIHPNIALSVGIKKEDFENLDKVPNFPDAVPIVVGGGTSLVKGFMDVFMEQFNQEEFPIKVSEVVLIEDAHTAVARGCLSEAQLIEEEECENTEESSEGTD